jgi:hypothetical protein
VRVLQVIHDYLPLHAAGSEIYTASLCRALSVTGHAVAVFTCEVDRAAPQWSLREREHEGVPVFEGIYNRIYADVSEHWDDPRMSAVFAEVLDRWRPTSCTCRACSSSAACRHCARPPSEGCRWS